MPRKSTGGDYPPNWNEIAREIKESANWRCVRCGHPHDPASGHTLTVHHLDMCPAHSDPELWWFNLAALCQKCHLQIQAKVQLDRPWLWEHSEWFKPFAGGYFAWKYLGQRLSRAEVEADLEYYAGLEARWLAAEI